MRIVRDANGARGVWMHASCMHCREPTVTHNTLHVSTSTRLQAGDDVDLGGGTQTQTYDRVNKVEGGPANRVVRNEDTLWAVGCGGAKGGVPTQQRGDALTR